MEGLEDDDLIVQSKLNMQNQSEGHNDQSSSMEGQSCAVTSTEVHSDEPSSTQNQNNIFTFPEGQGHKDDAHTKGHNGLVTFAEGHTSTTCTSVDSSSLLCDSRSNSSLGVAPKIDDFVILKPISRGAFGKVFLCHRKDQPDRKLAVKVMKKTDLVEKNLVTQAIAERNAMARTKSPFCVDLYYCLQTNNNMFLVMEYMIGGDMKSLLGVYGYFEESMAVFYIAEVILALEYLHSKGIVHRDVKPDNMLISNSGHLKLTDFGLSNVGINRELQVADLLPNTPWINKNKAQDYKLIRTPGQILSLTSHLSFVNNDGTNASVLTAPSDKAETHSLGGSFSQDTSQSRPTSRMFGSLGHGASFSKTNQTTENDEAKMSMCSIGKETPCTKASKSHSHATPAARGIKLTRKKSFIDVISQHQQSCMQTSQSSGLHTSDSFSKLKCDVEGTTGEGTTGAHRDGFSASMIEEEDFVLPPPSSSFDNGHQDKSLDSCSSLVNNDSALSLDLNISNYDDVFSDKENHSPMKGAVPNALTNKSTRHKDVPAQPYTFQSLGYDLDSKLSADLAVERRTGFHLSPGAAAGGRISGFHQPRFSSAKDMSTSDSKLDQKSPDKINLSPLKELNRRPHFYIGSPDESSRSSLSSSPKILTCPAPSHPNISPVDRSNTCFEVSGHCHMSVSVTPPSSTAATIAAGSHNMSAGSSSVTSSASCQQLSEDQVTPRYPDMDELNAEKITPTFPLNFANGESRFSKFSQARLNMADIRQAQSPENLRDGESFNSDLQLDSADNSPPTRHPANNTTPRLVLNSPPHVLSDTVEENNAVAETINGDNQLHAASIIDDDHLVEDSRLSSSEMCSPPKPLISPMPARAQPPPSSNSATPLSDHNQPAYNAINSNSISSSYHQINVKKPEKSTAHLSEECDDFVMDTGTPPASRKPDLLAASSEAEHRPLRASSIPVSMAHTYSRIGMKSPEFYTIDEVSETNKRKRNRSGSGSSCSGQEQLQATSTSKQGNTSQPHTGLTQDLTEMLRLRKRSCPNLRQFAAFTQLPSYTSSQDLSNHLDNVQKTGGTQPLKPVIGSTSETGSVSRMSVDSAEDCSDKVDLDSNTVPSFTNPNQRIPPLISHDNSTDISRMPPLISHDNSTDISRISRLNTVSMSTTRSSSESQSEPGDCTGNKNEKKDVMSVSSSSSAQSHPSDQGGRTMSTSSASSDETTDYPKLEYQYSTPLSAVPSHLKMLKNKMVKFLSPAGVTPVSHPVPPVNLGRQPQMSVSTPLSMADSLGDLNQISRIKNPLPMMNNMMSTSSINSSCNASVETPQKLCGNNSLPPPLPPPQFHTPPPQEKMSVGTPFRTPKSIRRRKNGDDSQGYGRILGTPDYLAPELLLRQAHDSGVDWWAVGVCLYEFMTGIPPFNDATPDLVFNNILALNIEWPEGDEALSQSSMEAILAFLRLDPEKRANGKTIKQYSLMKDVEWDNILDKTAPFIPQPDHDSDTTYFQTRNSMQGLKVSQIDL